MNTELRIANIEKRQNVLEHIIRVIFALVKSKLDASVRTQIENALNTLTELKKSVPSITE